MPITTTPSGGPQGEFSTYTPIYATTLTSGVSSITFSNIPTTFTDLVIVSSNVTCSNAGGFISLRFNGDSSSLYSNTYITASSSSVSSGRNSGSVAYIVGDTDTSAQTMSVNHIMNYSNVTTYKTILSRCGYGSASSQAFSSLWRSTSPVTSITLYGNGNINSGSTFTIYGIKAAAPAPKATGGDLVYTDNTYWYHVFNNSGVLDVKTSMNVDYLVVAGGGGAQLGGGGAGGLRSTVTATGGSGSLESQLSLIPIQYPIIVGAGGVSGSSGSNSTFSTITSTGGGAGQSAANGFAGGSGGGGGTGAEAATRTGGAASPSGQGFAGGGTSGGKNRASGGGGGAGAAGGDAQADQGGGPGAAGRNVAITGTSVGYAGGGGGGGRSSFVNGSGTSFGGGSGGTYTGGAEACTNGTENRGGGGGGGWEQNRSGGSGIVVVRYPV